MKTVADRSKELTLLIELLDAEKIEGLKQDSELLSKIDWQAFLELSSYHRVYPIIYKNIKLLDSPLVPTGVVATLHRHYVENTMRMMQLTAEMERVCNVFNQESLKMIILKGPILCYHLYQDLSSRTSNDLDILIDLDDLDKVTTVLGTLGYQIAYEPPRMLEDWKVQNHHIEFYNKEKGCEIEIHWKLNPGPSNEPCFEELWQEKVRVPVTTTEVYGLDQAYLLFHLITHGARHGWFRLRWLTDIDQLLKQTEDQERIISLLKKYKYSYLVGQYVQLASDVLKQPITAELLQYGTSKKARSLAKQVATFIENKIDIDHPPSGWEKSCKDYLYRIKNHYQKWQAFIRKTYPNSWDAQVLPLPKSLYFLYIPLRPFLGLWRYTRRRFFSIKG
ncbi:nucleotidyltransferase family protein [Paraliobacillus sediminis]|uniref:nucleotidyltransferase domain-containing protein n=1 Tax=Paraliobacillus sediminis TaxID=1885916 RepID=UPI000E3B813F|nr:nucleotidyltransferase family protein [Paraliobacillus sediminis]